MWIKRDNRGRTTQRVSHFTKSHDQRCVAAMHPVKIPHAHGTPSRRFGGRRVAGTVPQFQYHFTISRWFGAPSVNSKGNKYGIPLTTPVVVDEATSPVTVVVDEATSPIGAVVDEATSPVTYGPIIRRPVSMRSAGRGKGLPR